MAITFKQERVIPMFGSYRMVTGLITHDGSYAGSGGEAITAAALGLAQVHMGWEIGDLAGADIMQRFIPDADHLGGKIKAWVDADATGWAEATADQLDSALTVRFCFVGELV